MFAISYSTSIRLQHAPKDHLTTPDLDGGVDSAVHLTTKIHGGEAVARTAGIEARRCSRVVLEVVVDDHGGDVVESSGIVHVHVPVVVLDRIADFRGAGQQVVVVIATPPGGAVGVAAKDHGQDN